MPLLSTSRSSHKSLRYEDDVLSIVSQTLVRGKEGVTSQRCGISVNIENKKLKGLRDLPPSLLQMLLLYFGYYNYYYNYYNYIILL